MLEEDLPRTLADQVADRLLGPEVLLAKVVRELRATAVGVQGHTAEDRTEVAVAKQWAVRHHRGWRPLRWLSQRPTICRTGWGPIDEPSAASPTAATTAARCSLIIRGGDVATVARESLPGACCWRCGC